MIVVEHVDQRDHDPILEIVARLMKEVIIGNQMQSAAISGNITPSSRSHLACSPKTPAGKLRVEYEECDQSQAARVKT